VKPFENPRALRVLISGAGIAGPALAFWLLRYGFTPTIVERAPAFRADGYMIDVWGMGYDLVERFGLLNAMRDHVYVIDRLEFVNEHGGVLAGFGGDVFRRALAGRFFSIPRGDLARAIFDTIDGKVETLFGTGIEALHADASGVDVELTGGLKRRFDLVIGADGLRSHTRDLAFGPETKYEKYLGYYAASFTTTGYPHRNEATYLSYGRPGRQMFRYAMRDDRTSFLLVFAQDREVPPSPHDIGAAKALLRETFGRDGWESAEILSRLAAADDLYFDDVSQIRMPHWWRNRVALVGDAAHSPSLLAGAGSAFAMLGAYVLAGELHKANGDHLQAFAAYEKRLYDFILRQQKAAVGFAGSFAPRTSMGLVLRNAVVNLMNVPPLGVWLTRSMLGETFHLPDYA
jgi:2-polyprenyl-6-methoxyphenol hydroxylase-like FAD-dependent oxidoreductase